MKMGQNSLIFHPYSLQSLKHGTFKLSFEIIRLFSVFILFETVQSHLTVTFSIVTRNDTKAISGSTDLSPVIIILIVVTVGLLFHKNYNHFTVGHHVYRHISYFGLTKYKNIFYVICWNIIWLGILKKCKLDWVFLKFTIIYHWTKLKFLTLPKYDLFLTDHKCMQE